MASATVQVNYTTSEGVIVPIARVNRHKILHFSELAIAQLTPSDHRINPKDAVTIDRTIVDGKAATRVTKWIDTNSVKEPKQLTVAGLGLEQFDEVVQMYAAGYAFRLKRELSGDDLRNAVYEYMHQGSLTAAEFAMIAELLTFDGGLIKTTVHEIMFRYNKGGNYTPPDMANIEAYAKRTGMWEEMLNVGRSMQAGMNERVGRNAEKARQDAAKAERARQDAAKGRQDSVQNP